MPRRRSIHQAYGPRNVEPAPPLDLSNDEDGAVGLVRYPLAELPRARRPWRPRLPTTTRSLSVDAFTRASTGDSSSTMISGLASTRAVADRVPPAQ